jgi:hypothetical protein
MQRLAKSPYPIDMYNVKYKILKVNKGSHKDKYVDEMLKIIHGCHKDKNARTVGNAILPCS